MFRHANIVRRYGLRPRGWTDRLDELTRFVGFPKVEPVARHRRHGIEFKREVAQEFIAGETLHGPAKRHDVSRNLIRIWAHKYTAAHNMLCPALSGYAGRR